MKGPRSIWFLHPHSVRAPTDTDPEHYPIPPRVPSGSFLRCTVIKDRPGWRTELNEGFIAAGSCRVQFATRTVLPALVSRAEIPRPATGLSEAEDLDRRLKMFGPWAEGSTDMAVLPAPAQSALPTFLSTSPDVRHVVLPAEVQLRVTSFGELPRVRSMLDLNKSVRPIGAVAERHLRARSPALLAEMEASWDRMAEERVSEAEQTGLVAGLWLPVELRSPDAPTHGVMHLVRSVGCGRFRADLHLCNAVSGFGAGTEIWQSANRLGSTGPLQTTALIATVAGK